MLSRVAWIAAGVLLGLMAEPIFGVVARVVAFAIIRVRLGSLAHKTSTASFIKAVKQGDVALATLLMDQGADPNERDVADTSRLWPSRFEDARTALIIAVRNEHIELIKLLLSRGADVNGKDLSGFTPLIEAVRACRADLVRLLLQHGAKPNQRNRWGETAMRFAAGLGHTELMAHLLEAGADINGGGRWRPSGWTILVGWTPLVEAVSLENVDTVKYLIGKGADTRLTWCGLRTPLGCLLTNAAPEIAMLIRKAGAEQRSQPPSGKT